MPNRSVTKWAVLIIVMCAIVMTLVVVDALDKNPARLEHMTACMDYGYRRVRYIDGRVYCVDPIDIMELDR
jgi:hypothetical protein